MYNDISDLREFYASRLGQVARRMIRRRIRAMWPDARGLTVLGLGYPTPYLGPYRNTAERVLALAPAQQGAGHWPQDGPGLTTQVHDNALPLQDVSVDRALIVHGLECSENAREMLQEVWRVLAGNGRLMVVVPNRRSLWSRFEHTPFGHGHPYSPSQLSRMLRANRFTPDRTAHALYAPPGNWRLLLRSAHAIEDLCARRFRRLGGVIIIEASKQVYAAPRAGVRTLPRRLVPATVRQGSTASASGRLAS